MVGGRCPKRHTKQGIKQGTYSECKDVDSGILPHCHSRTRYNRVSNVKVYSDSNKYCHFGAGGPGMTMYFPIGYFSGSVTISTKTPQKIRGKFGAKFGSTFGMKIRKVREIFVLQLFWPNNGSHPACHLGGAQLPMGRAGITTTYFF